MIWPGVANQNEAGGAGRVEPPTAFYLMVKYAVVKKLPSLMVMAVVTMFNFTFSHPVIPESSLLRR